MTDIAVSSKGQIVLPKRVRTLFGLRAGSRLRLQVEDGRVVLTPGKPGAHANVADGPRILAATQRRVSIDDMRVKDADGAAFAPAARRSR
ncbi:MAG: AbrB/MazE/SpoVT family DNA-binding domain-containing protein [Betaproteobacteria bacterium]